MLLPQAFDQLLHLDAGQRIQRAERFVEQQQARPVDQRAGQGDALLLAAGQGRRPFMGAIRQPHFLQRLQGLAAPVAGKTEADVVDHPLPRQQPRVLEHQAGFLAGRLQRRRTGQQRAAARLVEPGQQAQQGALAAAAAADDGDELAGWNVQLDALQHFALAKGLAQTAGGQRDATQQAWRLFLEHGHAPSFFATW
ncbi:hypothetical protein D3C76_761640 [compost metagenome]